MLSAQQRSARARRDREAKITRLCARVDRYVALAEKFPRLGKTRARYMASADKAREELRAIDH